MFKYYSSPHIHVVLQLSHNASFSSFLQTVHITFTTFSTQDTVDLIRVHTGSTEDSYLLTSHSGSLVPTMWMESAQEEMLLTFHTNPSIGGSGFAFNYEFCEYSEMMLMV